MGRRCWPVAAIVGLLAAIPQPVSAHVKWFVEPGDPARPRVDWSLVISGRTALVLLVAAGALGLLAVLQRLVGDAHWPDLRAFEPLAAGAPTLLAVQAAIALVYAAVQPALFVPNIPLPVNAFGLAIAAVELLIAFAFITGIGDWAGALALILLVPLSLFRGRYFDTLDMLFWVGIGAVVLVVGRGAADATRVRPWLPTWVTPRRAVAALRVITGLSIMAPAFSEKLWNPRLGALFLQQYPTFNVMRHALGQPWFSDQAFVLCAGVAEATIGLLLASGLLPRVVILGAWLPFNLGIPFLPHQELVGHLPILGIMYFLLVHSSGAAATRAAEGERRFRRFLPARSRPPSPAAIRPLPAPVPGRGPSSRRARR